jgi:clumping factor A
VVCKSALHFCRSHWPDDLHHYIKIREGAEQNLSIGDHLRDHLDKILDDREAAVSNGSVTSDPLTASANSLHIANSSTAAPDVTLGMSNISDGSEERALEHLSSGSSSAGAPEGEAGSAAAVVNGMSDAMEMHGISTASQASDSASNSDSGSGSSSDSSSNSDSSSSSSSSDSDSNIEVDLEVGESMARQPALHPAAVGNQDTVISEASASSSSSSRDGMLAADTAKALDAGEEIRNAADTLKPMDAEEAVDTAELLDSGEETVDAAKAVEPMYAKEAAGTADSLDSGEEMIDAGDSLTSGESVAQLDVAAERGADHAESRAAGAAKELSSSESNEETVHASDDDAVEATGVHRLRSSCLNFFHA